MKKIQEWEITSKCNYNCWYCSLPNIKTESNKKVLKNFMDKLDTNTELFLFGGEPFLHPEVKFILNYLDKIKQPFVVQSNLSTISIKKIISENLKNFLLQGSVHPSEINLKSLISNLNKLKQLCIDNSITIRRIDIMYIGKKSLIYYREVQKIFPEICYMLPIAGFYENESNKFTKEYNSIRFKRMYSWIRFEENYIKEYSKFRSELWEDQNDGKFTTFGKPCPYDYTLWDSKLNKTNCCYRENTNGICNKKGCFWM